MSALLLAWLLCTGAAAHCGRCGAGAGEGHDGGGPGASAARARQADRKLPFTERADIPQDEGSRVYEAPAAPAAAEEAETAAPATPTAEDARDNMRAVLEARLAKTGRLWRVKDRKTGKPRGLALQDLAVPRDEGGGRWAARATFRDKAGTVSARVLVDLSGERWRVVSLEPETAAPRQR